MKPFVMRYAVRTISLTVSLDITCNDMMFCIIYIQLESCILFTKARLTKMNVSLQQYITWFNKKQLR